MEVSTLLDNLGLGFSVAVSLQNLFWCLMGAIIGTAIGVLPGVGPVATMALLLPATYFLPAEGALIMLAGIYYGAQYGGSTTAILVNLPGEASSVVTCLDGYQMARQGRAGPALAIAAIGSFFAGCVATVAIAVAAPPLTKLAQQFAPADYFSLMTLGLVFAIVLARGSIIKALGMVFLGHAAGAGRHRRQHRQHPLHPRHQRSVRRHRLRAARHGRVRHRRDHGQPDQLRASRPRQLEGERADADQGGPQALAWDPSCAARSWAGCSAFCPAAARCLPRSPPTQWRRGCRARRRNSAPA